MARAYYNDTDPAAAAILRHMIDADVIAPGDVDTRSIKEVHPNDVAGYTQCHFFAGGGLWSVAARLAGWPDDRELWTGSCPCQPFSAAGKGLGTDDPRHLWPDFHRLIGARRPVVVMGEQVAGKAGRGWFDGVGTDLEGDGFAARTVDFPACSIDAPHQRNRMYWIAVAIADQFDGWSGAGGGDRKEALNVSDAGVVADGAGIRQQVPLARRQPAVKGPFDHSHQDGGISSDAVVAVIQRQSSAGHEPDNRADASLHADADRGGRAGRPESQIGLAFERAPSQRPLLRNGSYWSEADWIACHDGKARRAQSGIRFLVDGLPGRVDLWRVGGNAIVPEAAAEVIAAFMDVYGLPERIAA